MPGAPEPGVPEPAAPVPGRASGMLDAMPAVSAAQLSLGCLGAFLAGSVPFGLVLVRLAGKGDVRAHGSGNIGATNVSRVGGKALGVVTLLLDIAKGWLPVWLAARFGFGLLGISLVALAAVAGHIFTPWLRFKGGKGVATALGAALGFLPVAVLPSLGLFAAVLLATRYVSLGSVLAAALMPFSMRYFLAREPFAILLLDAPVLPAMAAWGAVFLLVILKHHENLGRLLKGTESPLWGRRKEAPDA